MYLLRTYSKLTIIRNYLNYLLIVLSIIFTYLLVVITMVYMDNILILSTEAMYTNLHYIFVSIRTIFLIAGVTYIINQYYNIMKSTIRDYCIFRGLGATRNTIRVMILIQMFFLIIISIPIGLLSGFMLTGTIVNFLCDFSLNYDALELLVSSSTFFLAAGLVLCLIIFIGIYLERGVRKMPLSNIFRENPIIDKKG